MTNATLFAAAFRALSGAGVAFVGTMLATFQALPETMLRGDRWENAAIAGGIAAMSVLGFRGIVEGGIDTWRQANDKATPADVQAPPIVAVVTGDPAR